MYNGMTTLHSKYKSFHKTKNKINTRGVSPFGNLWMYRDLERIMYYRENDKFLSYMNNRTDSFWKIPFHPQDAYINPIANKGNLEQDQERSELYKNMIKKLKNKDKSHSNINKSDFTFTDEDVRKYMSDEYKGREIYYRAFMQHFIYVKKHEPLGYEMLNDNADEIFDDVDIIMTSSIDSFTLPKPYGYQYGTGVIEGHYLIQNLGKEFLIPPNVLNKLRNASNIIPYKSDIFDWVVKTIDGFSHLTSHKYKETPPEFYKKDKKLMWGFLDHALKQPIKIAEFLMKNNIPYRYFDLDNDSYNEVFGGDFEIDREYTSHAQSWIGYDDRYNEVANIAKEYISLRNLSQPYIPPKL